MIKGVAALFALMMFVFCGNTTTAKNSDKTSTAKSEVTCCSNDTKSKTTSGKNCEISCSKTSSTAEAGTVEVLYMHGKQRCVTCVAIGTEAEAFVNGLDDDRVVLKTIDYSTAVGEKIADKYKVASSSLIVVKDGKVDNLTTMAFQYAKNNPEQFKKSLNESIQKMLK